MNLLLLSVGSYGMGQSVAADGRIRCDAWLCNRIRMCIVPLFRMRKVKVVLIWICGGFVWLALRVFGIDNRDSTVFQTMLDCLLIGDKQTTDNQQRPCMHAQAHSHPCHCHCTFHIKTSQRHILGRKVIQNFSQTNPLTQFTTPTISQVTNVFFYTKLWKRR